MRGVQTTPVLALAAIAGMLVAAASTAGATGSGGPERVELKFDHALPNVPGKKLTSVLVTYAPGAKSPPHKHAGSVYVYVLSGMVRSQNSATGPLATYRAGESFFEPPGSIHLVSENASATEPASFLAVFVADDGAVLTAPAK